jgi:MoaA/NifB/PqqE/SkfB family radical SAM enzyme
MLKARNTYSSLRNRIRAGIADGSKAFIGPEHVVIDLTNRCNNRCIACWTRSPLLKNNNPAPEWHQQELDTYRASELIEELHEMGTSIIRFTGGGEPFMHPGIYKLIRMVKSKGIYCSITTNGILINPKKADELVALGLDEMAVSLWAANPEDYLNTHPNQTRGTFEHITRVIKHINRRRRLKKYLKPSHWFKPPLPRINVLNVICNLNYQSVEAMYDYALEVGADSIYFTVVDTMEGSTDSLLLTDEQRRRVYQACIAIQQKNAQLPRYRRIFLDNFSRFKTRLQQKPAGQGNYDQNLVDGIPCYVGWFFCRIMADGQVAPCCRGVHIPMGNINQSAFTEIWHSKKYNTFRRKAKNRNKNDRYFSKVGCHKTCDNYMHNLDIHNWL